MRIVTYLIKFLGKVEFIFETILDYVIRGPDGYFWCKKSSSKISCLGTFKREKITWAAHVVRHRHKYSSMSGHVDVNTSGRAVNALVLVWLQWPDAFSPIKPLSPPETVSVCSGDVWEGGQTAVGRVGRQRIGGGPARPKAPPASAVQRHAGQGSGRHERIRLCDESIYRLGKRAVIEHERTETTTS